MIKPDGDLIAYKASGSNVYTIELPDSSQDACFLRYTPLGLVLVRSYYPEGATLVEAVFGGVVYRQWYKHILGSNRAASLLVNRFISDVDAFIAAQVR